MLSLSAEMLQLPAHENPPRLSSNKCKTEVLAFWHFKVLIFELMLFSQILQLTVNSASLSFLLIECTHHSDLQVSIFCLKRTS